MRYQTFVLDKGTNLQSIRGHNFLLLLSARKWKYKSMRGAQALPGRYSSLDMCNYCLSPRLAAFPLFSKITDKKLVQSGLPEFIYCTLLNFPLLRSLDKEALHSKPLLVCQSNTLTFSSSAVIEGYFLSSKGSYGISVIALHITGNNPGSPCLSSLHAGLVWGGLVALFPRV